MTHTPGPWSIPHFATPDVGCKCGYVLVDGFCGAVATVHFSGDRDLKHGDNPPFEEAVANAHLIAAAPELAEALCESLTWLIVTTSSDNVNEARSAMNHLRKYIAVLDKAGIDHKIRIEGLDEIEAWIAGRAK
jgi:hypothetical protein